MTPVGSAVFADLLRAIEPYLDDVVFVGGWVHALYVLEAEGSGARVIRTADIDVTLAPSLKAGDRPELIDLLKGGGFEVESFDADSGFKISKDSIDVDLLADAPSPRRPVEIAGQSGLRVFGYPHQALLRDNARRMLIGPDMDNALPNAQILVPVLPAYVTGKLLSSSERSNRVKRAKDLAYLSDLMSRDSLRTEIVTDLPGLLAEYSGEARLAQRWLKSAITDEALIREVAGQVIEASGFGIEDDSTVRAQVKARLARLLAEGFSGDATL
ncbi:MAG: nucleotidyltransferase domain-containing protein [Gemmatimonadota bacterium]|nr:nucleotidyltransferase domain-containing protein [Gemmatimonadota bacterium]